MFFGASFDCATVPSAKCAASVAASAAHIKESDEYWSSGAEVGADRSAADEHEAAAARALAEDFGVPPEEHALKPLGLYIMKCVVVTGHTLCVCVFLWRVE